MGEELQALISIRDNILYVGLVVTFMLLLIVVMLRRLLSKLG